MRNDRWYEQKVGETKCRPSECRLQNAMEETASGG